LNLLAFLVHGLMILWDENFIKVRRVIRKTGRILQCLAHILLGI
jgi:hypothetical protein